MSSVVSDNADTLLNDDDASRRRWFADVSDHFLRKAKGCCREMRTLKPRQIIDKLRKPGRYALGVIFILLVVVIWVSSSSLIQYVFAGSERSSGFSKPFFVTYTSTSLFTVYLTGFLLPCLLRWRLKGSHKGPHPKMLLRLDSTNGAETVPTGERGSSVLTETMLDNAMPEIVVDGRVPLLSRSTKRTLSGSADRDGNVLSVLASTGVSTVVNTTTSTTTSVMLEGVSTENTFGVQSGVVDDESTEPPPMSTFEVCKFALQVTSAQVCLCVTCDDAGVRAVCADLVHRQRHVQLELVDDQRCVDVGDIVDQWSVHVHLGDIQQ
jgi:hypothetical protein